jgi:hypothetical protein
VKRIARTRERIKGRKEGGRFMLIPYVVLDSPDVLGLSAIAFKLLMMMFKQFNGGNNGDFSAPFST